MYYKIKYLFDNSDKKKFFFILVVMLGATFLEVLSIGLIVPFVSIIINDEYITQNLFIKNNFPQILEISKQSLVIYSLAIFFFIFLLKLIYMNFMVLYKNFFLYNFIHKLSDKLFKSYISRKYDFHIKNNTSKIINNLQIEIQEFAYNVLLSGLELMTEIFIFCGLLTLLIFIEPGGFLVMGSVGLLFIFTFKRLTQARVHHWSNLRQQMHDSMIKQIQQGIGGIRETKIMLKELNFIKYFSNFMKKSSTVNAKSQSLVELPRHYIEFLALLLFILLIFFSISKVSDFTLIIPTLSVFAAVAFKFLPAANRISSTLVRLGYSKAIINSIYTEIKYFNEEGNLLFKDISNPINKYEFKKNILVKNLTFKYENHSKKILDRINIELKKGETVGIMGESGEGKTTLINIITGLLNPIEGEILVDGKKINQNIRDWRSIIGYIPQNPFMLDDTVYNNVTFQPNNEDFKDLDQFFNCLKDAQIFEYVNSLDNSYKSFIGEKGVKFSGGQLQRLSIARALYNKPQLLMLDEATSALDIENEKKILNTINNIKYDKTVIIISHKLSALNICDRILKLKNGKLTEIK